MALLQQLALLTPPPTARRDWQPRNPHTPRLYHHTFCRECRATVWALWTPGGWMVGECGHTWREEQ